MSSFRPMILTCVLAVGCDVISPPPPEVIPPPPGFQLSTPFPDVRSFSDVLVLGRDRAIAVGTGGAIARLSDDGTWSREDVGTDDLLAVDGFISGNTGEEHVLAVGANGAVLEDRAGVWTPLTSGTTALLFAVTLRNDEDAFMVGDAGTILRFDGTAVTLQTDQTAQIVVGGDGSINAFPIPEPLKGVGGSDPLLAVGARGAIYRYDPNGEPDGVSNKWTRENSGTTRSLAGIFTDAGVWVPTTDGVLLRRNGDNDWDDESFRVPSPVFLQDVWVSGSDVFAVGLSEDLYHFDDTGTWTLTRVAEGAELRAVDGVFIPGAGDDDPGTVEVLAVGNGGRIVRGPRVEAREGETLLEDRAAVDDFAE